MSRGPNGPEAAQSFSRGLAMNEQVASIGWLDLGGENLRTVRIGGSEYVTVGDVSSYLHSFSARLQDLIARQQDQLTTVCTSLEVLVDVLSDQHPELASELLRIAGLQAQSA